MAAMIMVGYENCVMFILLCLFPLLCYSLFFKKPKNGIDLPPSPPAFPIFGHSYILLSSSPHKSLQTLSSKYGPLLHLRIFNIPVVIVSSASTAYEIFKTQDANVSSRGPTLIDDPVFAGSASFISSSYGDHWKFMKKLLVTKLVGPQALERTRQNRADERGRFYKSLLDKAMKGESVGIYEEAMNLSINNLCQMLLGRSSSEEKGETEIFKGLATSANSSGIKILSGNMSRQPIRKLVTPLYKKDRNVVSKRFDDLFERILTEHEEKLDGHQQGRDLMDALLAAYRDDNAEYKITRNHIKTLLADLIFAGPETSSQGTQWAMAEILNNPKVHKRLREEIDSVVGTSRLIQESDIPKLPYLQAVIKEVLRLHPPATLFGRKSEAELRVGKFYVPEQTSVVVNMYAVMRDPDSWEDPDEFKPERFLQASSGEEYERKEQSLKYMPFGCGRRACPGSYLAYVFLETTIGLMVQGFDWRINGEKIDMEETGLGLVLTMAHPPKLTPVPRTRSPLTF